MSDIQKQWEQDIVDYGIEGACKLWQDFRKLNPELGWCDLSLKSFNPSHDQFEWIEYRRKDSADLPFDLERAKAGDIVEYKNKDGIWECVLNFSLFNYEGFYIVNTHDFMSHSWVLDDSLRMKYPPKVNI